MEFTKEVLLQWQTADEKNVAKFSIERSTDGIHFTSIGEVKALGNTHGKSDYQFIDYAPLFGSNYYRLKIIDEDQQFAYSNIIQLQNKATGTQILNVFPNPVHDLVNIEIQSKENEQGILQLIDASGKVHTRKTIDLKTGYNKKSLSLEAIPAGVYQLQLVVKSGVYAYKVIKQ
ncbi:MAG: T9SS type A sorting domain-containing protein [Bacteroidetes bacterium]|nr:T9SS type A sorting domain-containing protein [Bacteroidota bacterium]